MYNKITVAFKLDKIFNFYVLIAINAIIIVLALTVGGGKFFFDTGLIHVIAILFVALAVSRVFFHHYTFDPILEKFVHANLVALFVFAASHIAEFISLMILKEYTDTVFVNVANFYLISIFSIIIGASYALEVKRRLYATILRKISFAAIAALLILITTFVIRNSLVSLEPDRAAPYGYAIVLLVCGSVAFFETIKIKKLISLTTGFCNYVMAGTVLIVLAAFSNVFYEIFQDKLGISEHMSVYLSHFAFYAALSLLFLAFSKLSYLGGVYEDLKKINSETKNTAG